MGYLFIVLSIVGVIVATAAPIKEELHKLNLKAQEKIIVKMNIKD